MICNYLEVLMKSLILPLMFLASTNAMAFDLKVAAEEALFQADTEIGKDNIAAYQATVADDEVEVEILTKTSDVLVYGCHKHGPQMACHEEGHDHLDLNKDNSSEPAFDQMQEGAVAAIAKLEKTLQQRGTNLNSVTSYKVWTTEGTDDEKSGDHLDIWVRFDYKLNNQDKTTYVLCHEHGHGNLACHYAQAGNNEPQF